MSSAYFLLNTRVSALNRLNLVPHRRVLSDGNNFTVQTEGNGMLCTVD
jgi:hypothetical protein